MTVFVHHIPFRFSRRGNRDAERFTAEMPKPQPWWKNPEIYLWFLT